MPLVWLAHHSGVTCADRVDGPDFMLRMCETGIEDGLRHFFYGGRPGVPERLANQLEARFPRLNIVGMYSPPFRRTGAIEEAKVIDSINNAAPDAVWIGLGTPKQDLWLAQHRPFLSAPLLAAVGAAFDFHAGLIRQAPQWMQQRGLEWMYRLSREPRRLWHRYLVYNPLFVASVLVQQLGAQQYPIDERQE
jgi:N-acetylglucosaminyldiphosphoundecaprenol N-acetyl-beta-D-mannosaminyltransferase